MLSLEDNYFSSEALGHTRGGTGEAMSPPAKRQREEGEGVAKVGEAELGEMTDRSGWSRVGERGGPRLQEPMAGEHLLSLDTALGTM